MNPKSLIFRVSAAIAALCIAAAPLAVFGDYFQPGSAITFKSEVDSNGVHWPLLKEADQLVVNLPSTASAATIITQETTGYRTATLQLTGTWVGTITPEISNDNVTFYGVAGYTPSNTGSTAPAITLSSNAVMVFPTTGRYFRVRCSAYTSGTITGVCVFRSEPSPRVGINLGNATIASTQSGTWTVQPGNTQNTTAWLTTPIGSSAQGASSLFHLVAAASTNATMVKGSAGTLNSFNAVNASASVKFVKLFNKASAPTVGTDTPVYTLAIPAGDTREINCGAYGLRLATGIALAITGAAGDLDTTAVVAGDVIVSSSYF